MRAASRLLVILAVGVALIWGLSSWLGLTVTDFAHLGQAHNAVRIDGEMVRVPSAPGPAKRQLPAVPVTTTGEYAFMFDDEAQPVRYDPCRPLAWVLNPKGMPDAAETLVHDAFDSVEAATGLKFEYEGTTTEVASFDRPLIQDRYGDGFAPIIVGFADETAVPQLAGSVTGIGGSSSVYGAYGDQQFLHSGTVILDAEDIGAILGTPIGIAIAQAVIQHEVGHVVGLAHVEDISELMNASNTRITEWGPGDRAGLAIAGDGPCE